MDVLSPVKFIELFELFFHPWAAVNVPVVLGSELPGFQKILPQEKVKSNMFEIEFVTQKLELCTAVEINSPQGPQVICNFSRHLKMLGGHPQDQLLFKFEQFWII